MDCYFASSSPLASSSVKTATAHSQIVTTTPGAPTVVLASAWQHSADPSQSVECEFEGIYSDIAAKLTCLLSLQKSVEDTSDAHDDAREYLKMLHLVVTGAWAKETLPVIHPKTSYP